MKGLVEVPLLAGGLEPGPPGKGKGNVLNPMRSVGGVLISLS